MKEQYNISTLFNNNKIFCYGKCSCCNNEDFISKSIIQNNCWEPNITSLFIDILSQGSDNIVFDVGCNIGYYSIISSKYCKKIFAFDANISNLNLLNFSKEINDNKNIQTLCCAVVEDENIYYKTDILHEHNIGSLKIIQCSKNESNIESLNLDNFIKNNNINKIDLMKIDIEGAELSCLKGLNRTLNSDIIKNLIIEITPLWDKEESKKILQFLKNKKYFLYDAGLNEVGIYDKKNNYLEQITKNPIEDIENFIANVKIQTNILAKK